MNKNEEEIGGPLGWGYVNQDTDLAVQKMKKRKNISYAPNPEKNEADMVNHPPHYTAHPSGVECIEITRHYNFNVGNAIKYCWRNGLKDEIGVSEKQIQDLEKAIFYLKDEIQRLRG